MLVGLGISRNQLIPVCLAKNNVDYNTHLNKKKERRERDGSTMIALNMRQFTSMFLCIHVVGICVNRKKSPTLDFFTSVQGF